MRFVPASLKSIVGACLVLMASAPALLLPAHAAAGPGSLQAALQQAQRFAHSSGRRGVAVLVLQDDATSRLDELLLRHSRALRFAFRDYALIALQPGKPGAYSLRYLRVICGGDSHCARDALLWKSFPASQIRSLEGAPATVPTMLVFQGLDTRPAAVSYGPSREQEILRFADGAVRATPAHPFISYGNAVLGD